MGYWLQGQMAGNRQSGRGATLPTDMAGGMNGEY